jgi:transposase
MEDKMCPNISQVDKELTRLREENKRLKQYEEQCNKLSQMFCKSLIAEGVPAAIERIKELEEEINKIYTLHTKDLERLQQLLKKEIS